MSGLTNQPFLHVSSRVEDLVNVSQVWTYNALQILAFVLNALIFSTAILSAHVKRAPIWFMFIGGWILWAVAHSLLFLSGSQFNGKVPPQALCLLQAALVYAFPPFMEFLNLGLVAHVYLVIRATIKDRNPRVNTPLIFVLLPIGIFLAILIEVLVIGLRNPTVVSRAPSLKYCHVTDHIPFATSAILCALGVLFVIGLEVVLGIMLYRNWGTFQVIRDVPGNATMVFRIFVFSVGPAVALIIKILSETIFTDLDFLAIVMLHSLPSVAAVIFGSQGDIIRAWYCCGGRRTEVRSLAESETKLRRHSYDSD